MRILRQNKKRLAALAAALLLLGAAALCEAGDGDRYALRLRELGFLSSSETGEDESVLSRAVFNFQKANAIPANGILDPTTLEKLLSPDAVGFAEYIEQYCRPADTDIALTFRDSGKQVKNLQTRLNELGYYGGEISGEYSMETACAVALFETVNGCEPDGLADERTMGRLLSPSAIPLGTFEYLETIVPGDRGANVKYMQALLKSLGYFDGECTGVYGDSTKKAVVAFEQRNGFEESGVWTILYTVMGKNARAIDFRNAKAEEKKITLKQGDTGYLVRELKKRLSELGYYSGTIDAYFDERTRLSVAAFQEANFLNVSGEADEETNLALESDSCADMDEFSALCETKAVKMGDVSYAVYLMCRRLQALGYPVEAVWEYDEQVAQAVRVFQYAQGLDLSDGVRAEDRVLMNSSSALSYAEARPVADSIVARLSRDEMRSRLVREARGLVGAPYEAGQTGSEYFGIGGFTYYCYALEGIEMQPTAALQLDGARESGRLTDDRAYALPAAQLFFRDENQLYTGILSGEGTVIYASPSLGAVTEARLDGILEKYEFIGIAERVDGT
ncbi:MAG: peptidoglycan-binding protein [Clostridia bacterium]|nr:peptidoglycan-binding protein [Clostridia bacterium]